MNLKTTGHRNTIIIIDTEFQLILNLKFDI